MKKLVVVILSAAVLTMGLGCGWSKKAQYGTAGAAGSINNFTSKGFPN